MITHKKSHTVSPAVGSWFYRSLSEKMRTLFSARISERWLSDMPDPNQSESEEVMVGYESSWPNDYKKLH